MLWTIFIVLLILWLLGFTLHFSGARRFEGEQYDEVFSDVDRFFRNRGGEA
jgi:Family of unknown function (DUF5670)